MSDKETKGANIGKIILIILILALLIACGVFCYFKFIKNNTNDQTSKSETNEQTSENNYTEFKIAKTDEKYKKYIIAKNGNNEWIELTDTKKSIIIFGKYDNKLYYADSDGIKYINLTDTQFSENKLFDYIEYGTTTTKKLAISKAVMIDDTIYFEYNTTAVEDKQGILSIKVSDTSIENAKQVINKIDMGKWNIDVNNKQLYYIEWKTENLTGSKYNDLALGLIKYDLNTGEKSTLIEGISVAEPKNKKGYIIQQGVEDFRLYDDKVLCIVENQSIEPDINGYYPVIHNIRLYDLNTKENTLISASETGSNMTGGLWAYAEYHNNDVYYRNGNSVIKYNNGKNDVIYTYSENEGETYLYGFQFLTDDVIEIIIQNSKNKYLVNGNVVSELDDSSAITVKMKDGNTVKFTADKIGD